MATSHEATTGHGVRKAGVEDEGTQWRSNEGASPVSIRPGSPD